MLLNVPVVAPEDCVLMFCALVLENPSENTAAGMWRSPFHTFGGMMLTHWKFYLRSVTNAIIDARIHSDAMTEEVQP